MEQANRMFTVIVENDESDWEDETGFLYHFPKKYLKYLTHGTKVIYYKGKLRNKKFEKTRLTNEPHYFALGSIGEVYPDIRSRKGDYFATIVNYRPFTKAIEFKPDGSYLEKVTKKNYWRDAVRPINKKTYELILSRLKPSQTLESSHINPVSNELNDISNSLESGTEGTSKSRFVTTYERSEKYRKQAIAIHGDTCKACNFNFGKAYGDYAEGYIHVHHIHPVSELDTPQNINPEKDLVPLCANCHSVVHRKKSNTLSIEALKKLIKKNGLYHK